MVAISIHDHTLNSALSFAAEGVMCLVKWGSDKLVVYTTHNGVHHMGLYQVCLVVKALISL